LLAAHNHKLRPNNPARKSRVYQKPGVVLGPTFISLKRDTRRAIAQKFNQLGPTDD
jgi:hypothetical protein